MRCEEIASSQESGPKGASHTAAVSLYSELYRLLLYYLCCEYIVYIVCITVFVLICVTAYNELLFVITSYVSTDFDMLM